MIHILPFFLALQTATENLPVSVTDPWKNLGNLCAAYALIFTAIFVYTWILGMRQKRLDKRIDELKQALKDASPDRRR